MIPGYDYSASQKQTAAIKTLQKRQQPQHRDEAGAVESLAYARLVWEMTVCSAFLLAQGMSQSAGGVPGGQQTTVAHTLLALSHIHIVLLPQVIRQWSEWGPQPWFIL